VAGVEFYVTAEVVQSVVTAGQGDMAWHGVRRI